MSRSEDQSDARIPQREIAVLHDRPAKAYDVWAALMESRARRRAIDVAEIRDGQNIWEVAAGTGLAFLEMVKRNPRGLNVGVDLSRSMLLSASRRLKRLPETNHMLAIGTAFSLPLKRQVH